MQRSPDRTDSVGLRAILALGVAYVLIGASFGAVAATVGMPAWLVMLMSPIVFAGAAQFLFVALLASGAAPLAAAGAGALVNLRLGPLSIAVRDALGTRTVARLLTAHLVTDESAAFALAQPNPRARRTALRRSGAVLLAAWCTGTVLGAVVGPLAGDGTALGLDAAFPALLFAVLLGALRDGGSRLAAAAGAVIGVAATPFTAAGIPALLALLGGVAGRRWRA